MPLRQELLQSLASLKLVLLSDSVSTAGYRNRKDTQDVSFSAPLSSLAGELLYKTRNKYLAAGVAPPAAPTAVPASVASGAPFMRTRSCLVNVRSPHRREGQGNSRELMWLMLPLTKRSSAALAVDAFPGSPE